MRELPEGWIETTLGEIAAINPRESIKKGSVAKSVAMEKLPTFDKRITGFELKPFKGGTKFRNGDTLLARITPCLENGKTAYVDILDEGEVGFGSTEYIVIREKDGLSDKQFLFYLATSPRFREIAIKCMTGTSGRQRVQTDVLINKPLFLPPLPEQKAIADMLSSLDEKIKLLREQNKTLETLAQTIFKEWFVKNRREQWEERKLGNYFKVQHGFAFKGKYISTEKNKNILVTPGNFKIGGGFKSTKLKYYHDSNFPESYILKEDDLVITMTDLSKAVDTLGYPALIPKSSEGNYLHNQRIGKVIFTTEICKYFLYFLMRTKDYQKYIAGASSGSSVNHTSPSSICDYSFFMPPKIEIESFSLLAKEVLEKIKNNESQIQTLSKNRDTLLPKLMNGSIRVHDFTREEVNNQRIVL